MSNAEPGPTGRPPATVLVAGGLGLLYAAVLAALAGALLWELVTGSGHIGREHLAAVAVFGVVVVAGFLIVLALLLVLGSRRLLHRGGPAALLAPLLLFLLIGVIGEIVDLLGDATARSDLIGAGILLAAAVPVALVCSPGARKYRSRQRLASPEARPRTP